MMGHMRQKKANFSFTPLLLVQISIAHSIFIYVSGSSLKQNSNPTLYQVLSAYLGAQLCQVNILILIYKLLNVLSDWPQVTVVQIHDAHNILFTLIHAVLFFEQVSSDIRGSSKKGDQQKVHFTSLNKTDARKTQGALIHSNPSTRKQHVSTEKQNYFKIRLKKHFESI